MTNPRKPLIAILFGFALLAAACAGDDTGDATTSASDAGSSGGSATESESASESAPEVEDDAADGEPTDEQASGDDDTPDTNEETPPETSTETSVTFPRTVEHELGAFTQEEPPVDVFIAASEIFGEAVLALGIVPSGRLDWFGGPPDPTGDDYGLNALETDVPVLGTVFEPDIETIVGSNPDLVLVFSGFGQDIHDQLEGTINVAGIDSAADWREILVAVGDALGRPAEADAALADYDNRLADLAGSAVGTYFADQSVAVVTPFDDPVILVPGGVIGDALEGAGISLWEPTDGFDGAEPGDGIDGIVSFSKELAGSIEADAVVVVLEGEGELTPTREAFLADPVWASIPAVTAGNVVFVTNNLARNAGPLTHYLFFDDLEQAVAAVS